MHIENAILYNKPQFSKFLARIQLRTHTGPCKSQKFLKKKKDLEILQRDSKGRYISSHGVCC